MAPAIQKISINLLDTPPKAQCYVLALLKFNLRLLEDLKKALKRADRFGPGGLCAPPEVAFAMQSWPLLTLAL